MASTDKQPVAIDAEGPSPYEILGLAPPDFSAPDTSSAEFLGPQPADVRRAFRKLALTKHPDKQPGNPRAADEFARIQAAADALSDPGAKEAWDALLAARAATAARRAAAGDKRKRMLDDLETRERAAEASAGERTAVDSARRRLAAELERLRKKHQAEEEEKKKKKVAATATTTTTTGGGAFSSKQPTQSALDDELSRTLKITWCTVAEGQEDCSAEEVRAAVEELVAGAVAKSKRTKSSSSLPSSSSSLPFSSSLASALSSPNLIPPFVSDVVLRPASKKKHQSSALAVMSSREAASVAEASGPALSGSRGPLLVLRLSSKKGDGEVPLSAAPKPKPEPPAAAGNSSSLSRDRESDTLARMREAAAAAKRRKAEAEEAKAKESNGAGGG